MQIQKPTKHYSKKIVDKNISLEEISTRDVLKLMMGLPEIKLLLQITFQFQFSKNLWALSKIN